MRGSRPCGFSIKFLFVGFRFFKTENLASFSVARVSHDDEAKASRVCSRSVTGGIQGNGEGGGSGRRETTVDKSRKETAGRVARYQTAPTYYMLQYRTPN